MWFALTRGGPLNFDQRAWDHYLSDSAEGAEPFASPLRARDLSGFPAALVVTAEYDPSRDEGEHHSA
jgi:acetyl esterase